MMIVKYIKILKKTDINMWFYLIKQFLQHYESAVINIYKIQCFIL